MIDLPKLSASKLLAEIDARSADHSASVDTMIRLGYGHCTGSEIREFAKESSLLTRTLLARQWVATKDALQAAYAEQDARRRYHGSDKPIKRAPSCA